VNKLSRRSLLMNLREGAESIIHPGSEAVKHSAQGPAQRESSSDCSRPLKGPYAHHFPNVVVYTHEGRKALFYDDLLRGKMVMINCMSIKNDAVFPVTKNLVRVQRLLGDRLGRDLFMYSITVDPENDSPRVLKAFAARHETGSGWSFLSGEPGVIQLLRSRLFVSGSSHDHSEHGVVEDCSLALMRYGNEAVGLWGAVPAKTEPKSIVARLSWIESGSPAQETFTRRGPMSSSR